MPLMKAAVFVDKNRIVLDEKPIPYIGPLNALMRITTTTICGSSQDGVGTAHGFKVAGGWKFGNIIDGCQAEYVRVPDAMANLSPIPDQLGDEQVLMCPDNMSTGFSGAERGGVALGDTVAVFALGPIGLCAVAGARCSARPPSLASTPWPSGSMWRAACDSMTSKPPTNCSPTSAMGS